MSAKCIGHINSFGKSDRTLDTAYSDGCNERLNVSYNLHEQTESNAIQENHEPVLRLLRKQCKKGGKHQTTAIQDMAMSNQGPEVNLWDLDRKHTPGPEGLLLNSFTNVSLKSWRMITSHVRPIRESKYASGAWYDAGNLMTKKGKMRRQSRATTLCGMLGCGRSLQDG